MQINFPENITPDLFIRDYWQQKPLLIKGGLKDYPFPVSPEELAGLAMEEEFESRVIRKVDQSAELTHGPFDEAFFQSMPKNDWTLLVQDVDKFVPEVTTLRHPFKFLPVWRFDDVMISYATPGGGVGPHVDQYDVFLCQGVGKRNWSIETKPRDVKDGIESGGLRLLHDFSADEEWILEQGDVLYLPAGFAHDGVAIEPCMTWSVGFRNVQVDELVNDFIDALLATSPDLVAIKDHVANPLEVSKVQMEQICGRLSAAIGNIDLAPLVAKALSRQKQNVACNENDEQTPESGTLFLDPAASIILVDGIEDTAFINDETWPIKTSDREILKILLQAGQVTIGNGNCEFLDRLYNRGIVVPEL